MKEPLLLVAVDGIVGGVEVQDQFLRNGRLRTNEHLDENLRHGGQGLAIDTVLQPAQGRRRRQRQILLNASFAQDLKQGVFPQTLVVVEVFIALGDAEDSLGQQGPLRMDDKEWMAWIGDTSIEGVDQSEGSIRLSQQQGPAIGGQFAALEISLDVLAFEA